MLTSVQGTDELHSLRGGRPDDVLFNDPLTMTRSLVQVNLSAATTPLDWEESRETYVLFPDSASTLLTRELEVIHAALGLDVTTTMSHTEMHYQIWSLLKGIVHRLRKQNQVIHANPHYFISSGLEVGCRTIIVDPDTLRDKEVETIPVPGHCSHCTNHGRYCIMPPADSERTGQEIIQETLMRICFAQIYHSSDLRFWEYMEHLDRQQCAAGELECSREALARVEKVSQRAIDSCMRLAGGTEEDNPNVHLQLEVDHRKGANPRHSYGVGELPMIHVGGKKYQSSDWSVEGIFPFVCEVFDEQMGMKPLACDFCEGCQDVRKCLWKLECDGKQFEAADFMTQEEQDATPPPDIVIVSPETPESPPPAVVISPNLEDNSTLQTVIPPPHIEESVPVPPPPEEETSTPPPPEEGAITQPPPEDAVTPPPTFLAMLDINATTPTASPTVDKYEERKQQQEEMDQMYIRFLIAFLVLGLLVLIYVCIRARRKRHRQSISDQFKQETQARWRAREMDNTPDDYSTSWPIGLVAQAKNSRVSRKNREKKSVHDQRLNADHSQTGQRSRFGLAAFSRQPSLENTPGPMYSNRGMRTRGGASGAGGGKPQPGFARHLSLEHSGALRPAGRQERRRSWGDDNRLTPAHSAALMEAATTSSPVPAQPMTAAAARRRPQTTLEDILSEDEESDDEPLRESSEASNRSQMGYSTSWLTGYGGADQIERRGSINEAEMYDASQSFEGLEDVTTL